MQTQEYKLNQRISILGCGWLGKALALELINKGYEINGSTRSDLKLQELKLKGITPFIIDISDKNTEVFSFFSSDVLIIAITSKNIVDFKNLIKKIEESEVRKVLFVSSTSVYPNANKIVTEETQTNNTPLANIERLFINNPVFKSTIVRFGGLFGYDRKPGYFVKINKKIENPEGYINFIHRDDSFGLLSRY